MKNRNGFIARRGMGGLLAVLAAITVLLLIGIWYINSDNTSAGSAPAQSSAPLFRDATPPAGGPSPVPGSRSELSTGGSLEMFSKTNAGYYGEEPSSATAQSEAAAEQPAGKPSAASPQAAKKPAKKAVKATVIPRMQSRSFGSSGGTQVSPTAPGQGMPDISGIMKQAQDQAAKQGKGQ